MIIWPILWILAMLSLIVATVVVAVREKKTRAKAAKQFAPTSIPMEPEPGVGDDMGQAVDGFGTSEDDAFASFDDPFK
jgi:hypothetical protein